MLNPDRSTDAHWKRWAALAAVITWVFGVACGCIYGIRYETTAAETEASAAHWPDTGLCVLSTRHPTLVMFVHPRCPCSRASLNELAWLVQNCQGRVDMQIVFFQPSSSPADWAKTESWDLASSIPGAALRIDLDGIEQQRFGARASGEVFVYGTGGGLLFHGGITAARGHTGDSVGRSAVAAILNGRAPAAETSRVFGCDLNSFRAMSPGGEDAQEGTVGP
ncbi:MAG: hypothetical protein HY290_16035 [Planctomycetia bacterium]|nr:hypothetical protein [Planctomycetia bacterium]